MAFTTIDDPTQYFEPLLWTGNGSSPRSLSGLEFQPDLIWSKRRDDAAGHNLLDSVRGAGVDSELCPSSTGVEGSNNANTYGYLSAFTSDGFTVTDGSSDNAYWNNNSATYVAWNWKCEAAFSNDASATSVGTIDSSGKVNTTAGISIISYTGNGTGGATIAHGLGVTPNLLIIKNRADSSQAHWAVWHDKSFVNASDPNILYLQDNAAVADDTNIRHTTATTNSSVFSIGDYNGVNGSSDGIMAYCFAEKQGYSKFDTYVGNGNADGPFIYTGFRPAWVMIKRRDSSGDWAMMDNKRPNEFNVVQNYLKAQATDAEQTDDSFNIDICASGFKCRYTNGNYNASGGLYAYIAFAESPYVNSNGIPNNAR